MFEISLQKIFLNDVLFSYDLMKSSKSLIHTSYNINTTFIQPILQHIQHLYNINTTYYNNKQLKTTSIQQSNNINTINIQVSLQHEYNIITTSKQHIQH